MVSTTTTAATACVPSMLAAPRPTAAELPGPGTPSGAIAAAEVPSTSSPASATSGEAIPLEIQERDAWIHSLDRWPATLELYGFAPLRSTGTTTIKGLSADTDLDLGELLPLVQRAASFRASLEKGRIGLLTDISYVQLQAAQARTTTRGLLTGRAQQTSIEGIYDLALRYRFGDPEAAVARAGAYSLIPYLGVRWVDAQLGLQAQIQGNGPLGLRFEASREYGHTSVQPLVGLQGSVFLSPRLRAFARADAAGFGLGGEEDLSANAQVGLGYAIGNSTDLNLSWRYLSLAYTNDSTPSSGYTSYQNGLELGLKFFF